LELAVEELEKQKAAVDAEIGAIRAELRGSGIIRTAKPVAIPIAGRRRKTPAERKALSERMRRIWAARKAAAAKKPIPASPKAKRAAVSKAISEAMKAAWARRKAKAAGNDAKTKRAPIRVSEKSTKS